MGIISTNKMFKSFALCALAGVAAASFRHGFDLGSSYGSSQPYGGYGIGRSYGGHNIHGTKAPAGRRAAGSFGQGATVRGHSGEQSRLSKGSKIYSQQYDVNDERVSRYNDSNARFAATKFGGRQDANRGQGDHGK